MDTGRDVIRIGEHHLAAVGAGDLARRALRRAESLAGGVGDGWRDARVLRFDSDRAVGSVSTIVGSGDHVRYEPLAVATGEVAVPAGTRVLLDLNVADEAAWQLVAQLEPGSIQGLVAGGRGHGPHHLPISRHVAHLTDLQELQLRDGHVDLSHLRRLEQLVDLRVERCSIEAGGAAADLAHLELIEKLRILDTWLDWRGFAPSAKLRVLRCGRSGIDDDATARLAACTELTELALSNERDLCYFDFLEDLERLRVLELPDTFCDDHDFGRIPDVGNLRRLDLSSTSIGDATLERLSGAHTLRNLNVDDTCITDLGIHAIRRLRSLEVLWCAAPSVTGASLRSIGRLRGLRNLHIAGLGATDDDARWLDSMTELRWLWASDNRFTDRFADQCPRMLAQLDGIDVSRSDIGQKVIRSLDGSRLRTLRIRQCTRVASIASLLACGLIDDLDANGCTSLSGLSNLARCRGLEDLRLSGTAIAGTRFRALAKLRSLRRLELRGTRADDVVLAQTLSRLPLLEHLDLADTRVGDASLHQLVEHPALRRVDLNDTLVSSAGIAALATCRQLEQLFVANTAIDDAALGHLLALTRAALECDVVVGAEASRVLAHSKLPGMELERAVAGGALDIAARIDAQLEQLGIARPAAANASRLLELDLRGTDVSVDGLLGLRRHPRLGCVRVDESLREALPNRHADGIEGTSIRWNAVR